MYKLTIPQQNIWNLHHYYEDTSIANNCGAIFFDKLCDHELLNQSINRLTELQGGMRLCFRADQGTPGQFVADYEWEQFPSVRFDSMDAFDAHADAFAKVPFAADGGKMYRFEIFDAGNCSGVLMCISHLIADAWAISIIAHTIASGYEALTGGPDADSRVCSFLPFLDAEDAYLASERYRKDLVYWTEKYPVRPEITPIRPGSLPSELPTARRYRTAFSHELSESIDRFYREHNISQAVLIESALTAYLSRLSPAHKQITLGSLILNRSGAEQKRAVANCITTMPLTIPVSQDMTAMDLCKEITRQHVQLFRHQKFPYSHILHDLHERYGFSGNLYDVLVSFQNAKSNTGAWTKWYSNGYCEVGLELHIDNRDSSDHYTVNIDYQTDLFPNEAEVELLFLRLVNVLEQILSAPDHRISELSIIPKAEQERLLRNFNDTQVAYPSEKCIHELAAAQVLAHPNEAALVFHGRQFTYREFDEMSNSLAHHLIVKGIGPGSIVPIVSKRSWHIFVAMLGILKAGAAYMHVDVTHPTERIEHMFRVAQTDFALVYEYTQPLKLDTLDLSSFPYDQNITPVPNRNCPEDLCYVIFTSGSTGKPKGLMISHRNAVNYCHENPFNVIGKNMKPDERSILAVNTTTFDISVTETLLPLAAGLTIYLADDDEAMSQHEVARLIEDNQITILQTTPTKMRLYMSNKENLQYLNTLRSIILGGEPMPADLYDQLRRLTSARIYNNYGPAETTVWSTIKEMTDHDITIGKPIANTQVYILDEHQQLLPIGVAGELCISGDGVGKGYLNRPDLTAERFLPDPFRPGQIMYRTGDLARWRMDGELECLGRIDTQVKIRGLRIELGEIESVLAAYPGVGLAAVTDKCDDSGRQYLVGYYTAEQSIEEAALRSHLASKLPQYMVPNFLVHLDVMPMTSSGKTDRKNLPTPDLTLRAREYTEPQTEQEAILCRILEELLNAGSIGTTDDFFELGGDSLCAIEYVAQAHNHGVDFALQNVFDYPTVRQLCGFISGEYIRKAVYDPADFVKYEPLLRNNVIRENLTPVKRSLGDVLLTGATGFLGVHVLNEYLKSETGVIWCLVRGGAERLRGILEYYFGDTYTMELGRRIRVLDGDITRPDLAHDLPDHVHTVIHTAATVKHYGPWEYFHGVNVRGTEHVIDYAKRVGAKLLHISTISVSGNSLVDAFDVLRVDEPIDFTEADLFVDQPLDNVYIRSKFEAERAVLDAALEGLDAKIIRVGNLTNRLSDFKFQPNYHSNAFLNRVRAVLAMKALPAYMMSLYAEFSPIDQTAEGVIKIGQYADRETVFHLNSHQNLYFDRMTELLNQLGAPMQVLDGEHFGEMLQRMAQHPDTAYIYEALQNDLDDSGKLVYDSNIHIRNQFTVWFMEKLGFQWAKIDYDYVSGYLNYFRNLGYFPPEMF